MSHISLDTSDNVPRQAFHEKVERIKELEAEVTRLTKALVECQQAFDNGRDAEKRTAGYGEGRE